MKVLWDIQEDGPNNAFKKQNKTKTKQNKKQKQNKTRHAAVTDGVPCRL